MDKRVKSNSSKEGTTVDLSAVIRAALSATPEQLELAVAVLEGDRTAFSARVADEPFLTLKQLSSAIGIGATTLWRYQIPGHVLGGRPRYKRSEVEAYLQSEQFKRRAAALRAERKKK